MSEPEKKRSLLGLDHAGASRFIDRAVAAGCTLLELRLAGSGIDAHEPVLSWPLPGAPIDEADDAAQNDAVGRTGAVRYSLVASKGSVWGRYGFIIDAGAGILGAENATMQGMLLEALRDKREAVRMSNAVVETFFHRSQQMIEFHAEQSAKAEEKHMAMIDMLEQMISGKADRDLKAREMELHGETTKKMVDGFMPLVPVAANRLLGHFTGTPAPLGPEMIRAFLKSFPPEQLAKMAEGMTPEQIATFSEIMRTIADEETKKETKEAKDRAARPNANGGVG